MRVLLATTAASLLVLAAAGCPPLHDGGTLGLLGRAWFRVDGSSSNFTGDALAVGAAVRIFIDVEDGELRSAGSSDESVLVLQPLTDGSTTLATVLGKAPGEAALVLFESSGKELDRFRIPVAAPARPAWRRSTSRPAPPSPK